MNKLLEKYKEQGVYIMENLKKFIDEYIKSLENELPPEILSKEIEVLKDFQDWVIKNEPELRFRIS